MKYIILFINTFKKNYIQNNSLILEFYMKETIILLLCVKNFIKNEISI